jgi:hypothetical protein
MKLSQLCLEVVSPEVHEANKKFLYKASKADTKYQKSQTLDPREHARLDKEQDYEHHMIKTRSPGELHSLIRRTAKQDDKTSVADDMSREHLKSLGYKALKSVKKLQD